MPVPGVGYSGLWINQKCPVFLLMIVTSKTSVNMMEKYFGSRLARSFVSNIGCPPLLILRIFSLPLCYKLRMKFFLFLHEALMQLSGFFLHKRLLCLNQLRSCSIQADDKLAVFAFDRYRISDTETGILPPTTASSTGLPERICNCIRSVHTPSVLLRSSLPCVCPPFSIDCFGLKQNKLQNTDFLFRICSLSIQIPIRL